ncbi:MAG: hypothetical protein RIC16_03890 [Rhodospirillales bacterium]
MKRILILGALAASVAWTLPTTAQEVSTAADSASVEQLVDKVVILTKSPTLTAVPENEPAAIDLSLVEVPGIDKALTKGVTAKAYTRYVTVENQRIAQVVLTAVAKDGRSEELNASAFSAQFDLEKPELDPSTPIRIEGDKSEIRSALERLAEQPVVADREDDEAEDEQSDEGASRGQAASNNGENPDAAAYETPDALEVAEADAPVVRVTTEGCDIRVDLEQGYAIQQSRVETTENGAVSTGTCEDSERKFPLQASYASCSDAIDLEARTATAQYILFYSDNGGTRQEISECTPDAEQVFEIVENREACTVYLDYAAMEAVPQASLIYRNANNADVQVRGCEASLEVEAVDLVETTDGCSIRHDYDAAVSYQQSRHVYTLEGVTWQAGFCADNETEYAHEDIYETEAGGNVCAPVVDLEGGTVTLQYRTGITVDGLRQYISECKPDTSSLQVASTTDGCTNPATWTHDVAAGVSYGRERFYYVSGGEREYVSECQDSDTVYTHQVETTGWQPHDDQLFAYALSTVYITPATGRYDIVSGTVLDGTPQTPYAYEGVATVASGEVTYEDCSRFEGRDFVDNYTRPDESVHSVVVGPADPLGPTNACSVTEWPSSWPRTNVTYTYTGCDGRPKNDAEGVGLQIGTYQGRYVVTREDGAVIVDETATNSQSRTVGGCTTAPQAVYNARYECNPQICVPSAVSGSTAASWNSNLGWTYY